MPEPNSTLINHSNESETHIRNRWDLRTDIPPEAVDIARYSSESGGYKMAKWQFCNRPFHLPISSPGSHSSLPTNFSLTVEQCYDFCWKSCAVYCAVNPDTIGSRPNMLDFFHAIYRCWFKGDETSVQQCNFFGKCIASWKDPEPGRMATLEQFRSDLFTASPDIPALIATHVALCAKIKEGLAELSTKERPVYHEFHVFKPIFEKVIVVLDVVNWDWEGLSIVRSDQARPLRLDCNNFDVPQPAFRHGDQGQVFRARLEDVVRLVESMRIREDEGRMWPGPMSSA